MWSQVACTNLTLTCRLGFTYRVTRRQDELAENRARFEQRWAAATSASGQHPVHDRPQPPGRDQVQQRRTDGALLAMVEPRTLSWRQKTWRRFSTGSKPGRRAADDDAPARARRRPPTSAKVAAPTCSTTMSAPRRPVSRLTSATMSLGRVVDGLVGAQRARRGQLGVGRRRRDHARAAQLGDLDRRACRRPSRPPAPARSRPADRRAVDQHLPRGHERRSAAPPARCRRAGRERAAPAPGSAAGTTTYSAWPPQRLLAQHPEVGAEVVAPAEAGGAAAAGQARVDERRDRPRRRSGTRLHARAERRRRRRRRRRPRRAASATCSAGSPWRSHRSMWFSAAAVTRTCTSPGPGRRRRDVAHLHHLGTAVSAKQRRAHRRRG